MGEFDWFMVTVSLLMGYPCSMENHLQTVQPQITLVCKW